jgi:hypothetical protein
MDKSIDISIVIVNWNTKELLLKCIESIKKEKSIYQKEIIVVDNDSSDNSPQVIIDHHPDVHLIRNKANLGFAKANNIGITVSKGSYLCLINSDVEVLDDCLYKLYEFIDSNPQIGIVGPKIFYPDMRDHDSCRNYPTLWNNFCEAIALNKIFSYSKTFSGEHMEYFHHDKTLKTDSLVGCFLMIRRAALNQIGLFDEQFFIFAEELDLCHRIKKSGWDVVFFPEAAIIHHHGASTSKDPLRFSIEQIISKIKYWKKHHGRLVVMTFLLILIMHHGIRLVSESILYFFKPSEKVQIIQRLSKNYLCLKYILSGKYNGNRASMA